MVPTPMGFAGSKGEKGERAVSGLRGPPGPNTGGVVYIWWGRTTRPHTSETELPYTGRAAGSHFEQKGGGASGRFASPSSFLLMKYEQTGSLTRLLY